MTRPAARPGFTLMEMMVVLAVLIVLGAVLLPTMSGISRDTNVKAGADIVHGLIAEARGRAIETGQNYRFDLSPDGLKCRVTPDLLDAGGQPLDSTSGPATSREESLPKGVTLQLPEGAAVADDSGWVRVATILTDGTCREDLVDLTVSEKGTLPIVVRIRGLTGTVDVVPSGPGGTR